MKRKILKITAICLAALLAALVLIVGIYVAYVAIEYDRIEDNLPLSIQNNDGRNAVQTGTQCTAVTYNVGFGAYSPEFSFFLDTGVMDDGTEVAGTHGKALSKEDVEKNVEGSLSFVQGENADFVLLQEVDEDSDRNYHVDMRSAFSLTEYAQIYAVNFHSANLLYPFHDAHGKSNSGIYTLSKFSVEQSHRRSLPLATDLSKFFDLDRCISITRLPVDGEEREFVLINLHLSAYDEGGTIRALQMDLLKHILQEEREAGNYVVAGGDFNHLLAETDFPDKQQTPSWIARFPEDGLPNGFSVCCATNAPTCRGADLPYEKGVNYTCVIDGFILSDNVTVNSVQTCDLDFAFSDHNPVKLIFTLNA